MRTRKELIYLNIKDLTQEERESLSDMDLAFCDNCGEIYDSEKLNWLEGEEFIGDIYAENLLSSGIVSICNDCWDKKDKISQCGTCENYFIATEKVDDCPHCGSGIWGYGCIDDPDPACFNCKGREDCLLECYQDCQYNPENEEEDTLPE